MFYDWLLQFTILIIGIGGLSKCFCFHSQYKNPNRVMAINSR